MTLEVTGLAVRLGQQLALDGVDLTIASGEMVGLIGPNGAGKTTLLRAVLGLAARERGDVLVNGGPVESARPLLGYVPQRQEFAWDFPITVEAAVLTGRAGLAGSGRGAGTAGKGLRGRVRAQGARVGVAGQRRATDRAAVAQALARTDLVPLRRRPIGELSGGQRQRVLMARALARRPRLLLLDEPFTGVDVPTQELLTTLFGQLLAEGCAVLLTTHDLPAAARTCSRLCLLNRTIVAEGPPALLRDPHVWLRAFGVDSSEQLVSSAEVAAQ